MKSTAIVNNSSIATADIPVVDYQAFAEEVIALLQDVSCHCVHYFCYEQEGFYKFIILLADDSTADVKVLSHHLPAGQNASLVSLTKEVPALHIFEREIHENTGIRFEEHPWLKPVRFPGKRNEGSNRESNYLFYRLEGNESHEVGVGPIHAGVIEPGHFRFSCYGEKVHHLEIQLGYQHRGIEALFLSKKSLIQRTVLAESITGDTVVGHTTAFARNMEILYGLEESESLALTRTIAAELERIGIHVGNISAVCQDIAYQLGSSVLGALRTPIINFLQLWCGNRFSKGLIRMGYSPYPLTKELKEKLLNVLGDFELKYVEMADTLFGLPSVQARLEKTGTVTKEQARLIGAVGLAAKITGIPRDIRTTHPYGYYKNLFYMPAIAKTGDVMAHAQVRDQEIRKSVRLIRYLLDELANFENTPNPARPEPGNMTLKPATLSLSLTEGWRGEIGHVAITDQQGDLTCYKVKDPGMHNWFSLALSLRDNDISDFPICNKSYDQSYCGFDL